MTHKDINIEYFQQHPVLKNHISLCDYARRKFSDTNDISIIRVPGRINLIGEHVDYNNGAVLPCAIDREIVLCLTENKSGLVRVSNVNPDYPKIQFSVKNLIEPDEKGLWGNYIKAGVKGIVDYFSQKGEFNPDEIKGFDAIISSTLPPAAGLSSSSTLVVGAAMSFLTVNNIEMNKLKVAEICAEAEHFVGTAGGGMDHAACLLGVKNAFLKINFNPLKAQPVQAPGDLDIILFHSLVEAEKSGHVREEYNRRVLECHLALDLFNQFISKQFPGITTPLKSLGEITSNYFDIPQPVLDGHVHKFLVSLQDAYTLSEILTLLNCSVDELEELYCNMLRGAKLIEIDGGYKLKGRFRHVYSECQRVEMAIKYLQQNDKVSLGKLLNASHKSLAEDYEVSTPEVDSIQYLLRRFGAYGSRIVGAGFGGMVLAISDHSHSNELIEKMKETFYSKKILNNLDNYIIRCNTADGAGLL